MIYHKNIRYILLKYGWRWIGILFTWTTLLVGTYHIYSYLSDLEMDWASNTFPLILTILSSSLASIVFTISRRGRKYTEEEHKLLSNRNLLSMPRNKLRYSDRIAWFMAELSEFSYQKFEVDQDYFEKFAEDSKNALSSDSRHAIDSVIRHYKQDLSPISYPRKRYLGTSSFISTLESAGFSDCTLFNKDGIQGYICLYSPNKPEFIAVVFRGTEKNIEDWLTNLHARPIYPKNNSTHDSENMSKVHGGFYNAYASVKGDIEKALARLIKEYDVPIFFTGHSQGGALATIASRELGQVQDYENSACYTFGCPRVANYSYFEFMKTPVYRIVNSSDIVPTIPPGIWAMLLVKLIDSFSHLLAAARVPTIFLETIKEFIADYQNYRHFGDLRYLTDVNSKHFERVMLLRNPHLFDSLLWFWRRVAISLGMPAQQHSMAVYRKKLEKVAENRLKNKPIPEQFHNLQD